MKKILYYVFGILVPISFLQSCDSNPGDEPDNPNEETVFYPEDNSISYFANGLTLPMQETSFSLEFYTNKKWEAQINYTSETKDWLSLSLSSGKAGQNHIVVNVKENSETVTRSAILRISCAGNNEYINIEQNANSAGVINVSTPGTLGDFIPEDARPFIKELTITGKLNGTDIKLIRSLFGTPDGETQLEILDLSEATIVSGGDMYYNVDITGVDCHTHDYTISPYMFTFFRGRILKIPNNTKTIEYCGLYYVQNVEELTIPNNLQYIDYMAIWCPNLKSLEIPASVKPIDEEKGLLLSTCSQLETLKVNSPLLNISIVGCENLRSLELYGGINTINNLPKLSSVILHEGITEIGANFIDCPSLKSITIPSSVKAINHVAFQYYNSSSHNIDSYLKEIHYKGNSSPWQIIPTGFTKCKLYVPESAINNFTNHLLPYFQEIIGE